jgi:hypothetical protein
VNAPLWVTELAARFWEVAGPPPPFPRDLEAAIHRLPLSCVALPELRTGTVLDWLRRCGIAARLDVEDRALHAGLVATAGHGIIFLNADDPVEERRFSAAHELGHFLHDYWEPRRRAVAGVGLAVLEVFDGHRPPTAGERIGAVIREISVDCHGHLLLSPRADARHAGRVREAEQDADRLAYEILAPARSVALVAGERSAAEARLCQDFGLPSDHAVAYATQLFPESVPVDPLAVRLARSHAVELSAEGGK